MLQSFTKTKTAYFTTNNNRTGIHKRESCVPDRKIFIAHNTLFLLYLFFETLSLAFPFSLTSLKSYDLCCILPAYPVKYTHAHPIAPNGSLLICICAVFARHLYGSASIDSFWPSAAIHTKVFLAFPTIESRR